MIKVIVVSISKRTIFVIAVILSVLIGLGYVLTHATYPVTVDEKMIVDILDKHPTISNTEVQIDNKAINIYGKATVKKYFLEASVDFDIELIPVKASDRTIIMEVADFEPLNIEYLNREIFNQPPFFTYNNGFIALNVGAWERFERLPLEIRSFHMRQEQIIINLGYKRGTIREIFNR